MATHPPPKLLESQTHADRVRRWLLLRPAQLTTWLKTYPGLFLGNPGAQALLLWAPSPQQAFPTRPYLAKGNHGGPGIIPGSVCRC